MMAVFKPAPTTFEIFERAIQFVGAFGEIKIRDSTGSQVIATVSPLAFLIMRVFRWDI